MHEGFFQPWHLLLLMFVAMLFVVPWVFYLLTLQKALARCSQQARTTSPESVWLMLIPLFNLVYQFILVINIAKSLGNEFARRGGVNVDPEPGKSLGIAMCVLNVGSIIPLLGIPLAFGGLVCWIIYWVKIAGLSAMIAIPVPPMQPSQSLG
ncbi:MAG: hypothetical protein ACLP6G_14800 [Terriglobales bacterium]